MTQVDSQLYDQPFDSIVIGGGLLGCSVAQNLALAGQRVAIIEQKDLASGASGVNEGNLSIQTKPERLLDYAIKGSELWAEMGEHVGYLRRPSLIVAKTPEDAAVLEQCTHVRRQIGAGIELYDQQTLTSIHPYINPKTVLASYCAQDAVVNAALIGHYYRKLFAEMSISLFERHWVVAIDYDAEQGHRVQCTQGVLHAKNLIIAAGAWSDKAAKLLGLKLPLKIQSNIIAQTLATSEALSVQLYDVRESFSVQKQRDDKVVIASGWRGQDLESPDTQAAVSTAHLVDTVSRAAYYWPALAQLTLLSTWHNNEVNPVDDMPLIGNFSAMPHTSFLLAGRGGFMMGPYLGKLLAEQITGIERSQELAQFSVERFS